MRFRLAALAASLAVTGLVAAPARAAVTQPSGRLCSWRAVQSGGAWTVVFEAGPLRVVDEDDPSDLHTATVTCSIRTSAGNHTGTVFAQATSDPAVGAAVLPPTAIPVGAAFPQFRFSCTQVDVDGTPLYWHEPQDRNVDGRWSTSPSATCDDGMETLDSRAEDQPLRTVISTAVTALGEAEVAFAAFESVACDDAAVEDAIDDVWWCGYPSALTSVSFVRVPGAAVLRTMPVGWTCTDVHTGLPVTRGSLLTVPDPGVSCVPDLAVGIDCDWVQVSGVLAPTTLGRVLLTHACGGITVTRTYTAVQGRVAEVWSGKYYGGPPPLRCSAAEDTTPVDPAYLALCTLVG